MEFASLGYIHMAVDRKLYDDRCQLTPLHAAVDSERARITQKQAGGCVVQAYFGSDRDSARLTGGDRCPIADDMPLPIRGRVVTTGVLIYEGDAARRVEFEAATRHLYLDFLPLLERDAREEIRFSS